MTSRTHRLGSLALAVGVVFLLAWGAIVATKHTYLMASIWPANSAALIALVRLRPQAQELRLGAGFALAYLFANILCGTTVADAAWFTLGNLVEVFTAQAVLRSRVFNAAVDGEGMQVVRLMQRLVLAAVIGPSFGAAIGAFGLSLSSGQPIGGLWLQWWLPSALSLLLVAPFGLLLKPADFAGLKNPRTLGEFGLIVALSVLGVAGVFISERMEMLVLCAPIIMFAAVRLRTLGAMTAILLVAAIVLPMAGMHARAPYDGADGRELITAIQGFLLIQAIMALAGVTLLDERDALAGALESERAFTAEQARARLRLLMEIAHDIRTPLNAIQGCADLMPASGPMTGGQSELLGAMKGAAQQLQTLAVDLLGRARIEHSAPVIAPALIAPAPILAETADEVRAAFDRSIRIHISAPADLEIWADPLRFRQIATNLISNAAKFAGAYGPIRVAIRDDGDAAVLEVHDQGPGFAPDAERNAFEPFAQQRTPDAEGAGIGLSLVKQIVLAHGGDVRVRSTPFVDTRVEASFPHQPSARAERARHGRAEMDTMEPDAILGA